MRGLSPVSYAGSHEFTLADVCQSAASRLHSACPDSRLGWALNGNGIAEATPTTPILTKCWQGGAGIQLGLGAVHGWGPQDPLLVKLATLRQQAPCSRPHWPGCTASAGSLPGATAASFLNWHWRQKPPPLPPCCGPSLPRPDGQFFRVSGHGHQLSLQSSPLRLQI